MLLELTNHCNHRCIYCRFPKMTRPKINMSFDEIMIIIDKGKEIGIKSYYVAIMGEPTLHSHFIDTLKYIKEKGCDFIFASNMELLNEEKIDAIMKFITSTDKIQCSMDSVNKEMFLKMRGEKSNFEKCINNTNYLINEFFKLKQKPYLIISRVITNINNIKEEENDFHNNFMEGRRLKSTRNYYIAELKGKYTTDVSKVRTHLHIVDICNEYPTYHVSSNMAHWWYEGDKYDESTGLNLPCLRLTTDLAVLANGDVALCCVDYNGQHIMGNIFEDSIINIYNNEKFQYMRDNFPTGLCKECNCRWEI